VTWWTVAIGVDAHKQWHVAVALDRLGRRVDWMTAAATAAGYQQLLAWARSLGDPVFGIEGWPISRIAPIRARRRWE